MKISESSFTVTDWSQLPAVEHPGETGMAYWRTINIGDIRARVMTQQFLLTSRR